MTTLIITAIVISVLVMFSWIVCVTFYIINLRNYIGDKLVEREHAEKKKAFREHREYMEARMKEADERFDKKRNEEDKQ